MSGESVYDVRMPDGTVIQNVPAGTTQQEVSRRYQSMRNAPILAVQAKKYPTSAEQGGKPGSVAPTPQAPSPYTDTGVWSGIKRGVSNLNPMNLLPQAPPVATNKQDIDAQQQEFKAGLQHMAEHPIASMLGRTPIVGPLLQSLAERAPYDPSGAAAEAITTAGIPYAAERGFSAATSPEMAARLQSSAEANRAPLPRRSILDASEMGGRLAASSMGAAVGYFMNHPALGASVATALNEIRKMPEYRNLKASAQELIAQQIVKLHQEAPQEYIPPLGQPQLRASSTFYQGTGEPSVDVSSTPQRLLPPAPPQGGLPSANIPSRLALPPGPIPIPAGTGQPLPPSDQLPRAYNQAPVTSPAPPPGYMGRTQLGEEGGIPKTGEQTATPTSIPHIAMRDSATNRFRKATEAERQSLANQIIQAQSNIGKTASEPAPTPAPPPQPKPLAKKKGK